MLKTARSYLHSSGQNTKRDGRTNGQTDRISLTITAVRIARNADRCNKNTSDSPVTNWLDFQGHVFKGQGHGNVLRQRACIPIDGCSRLHFGYFSFSCALCSHVTSLDSSLLRSTLFLHGVCMLRECIYGECAHEQHVRRILTITLTLTLTHTMTAVLSISGTVVRVRILICTTRQNRVEKEFTACYTE